MKKIIAVKQECFAFPGANLHEDALLIKKELDRNKKELAANSIALVTSAFWSAGMDTLVSTNTHNRVVNLG